MTLSWSKAVEIAHKRAGMSEAELRRELQSRDVSTQVITNWKKLDRPIPVERYPLFVAVIGHGLTTDELHGRTVREDSASYVVSQASREDQLLANEISKLGPEFKNVITTLVELIVAREKRAEKSKKAHAPARDRPRA
jgi:hypothetical protein